MEIASTLPLIPITAAQRETPVPKSAPLPNVQRTVPMRWMSATMHVSIGRPIHSIAEIAAIHVIVMSSVSAAIAGGSTLGLDVTAVLVSSVGTMKPVAHIPDQQQVGSSVWMVVPASRQESSM